MPAVFIYKDLKSLQFQNKILDKYQPTPDIQQSYTLPGGQKVMKYSCGQAIQMLPFFLLGHSYAHHSDKYESDGYSRPYQVAISFGALIIALIGLIFWRKWLLLHFNDHIVALTIILIGMGSNYFEYAGITGAMAHNNLFMLYAILLLLCHSFYESSSYTSSLLIGGCVGLMALTRPTEIVAFLIPLFYGLNILNRQAVKIRILFLREQLPKLIVAVLICIAVGFIQLIYWKYVSGDWFVYSYQEQGFSWFRPHILNGLFSYNNGWIPYSPIMIFSLFGLYPLFKFKKGNFNFILFYFLLFIYIAFAWDIWWYGGSLGQRTMVQLYPILSFPLALVIVKIKKSKLHIKLLFSLIAITFIYVNLWFVYQAHGGGMLYVEQMSKAYYWKTLGTWNKNPEDVYLLDNKDSFEGNLSPAESSPVDLRFSKSSNADCSSGQKILINHNCAYSPDISAGSIEPKSNWLRLSAEMTTDQKEWNVWSMPQMMIIYKNDQGKTVKSNMIRTHRLMEADKVKTLILDSKIPRNIQELRVDIVFWNPGSMSNTSIEDIQLICF